MTAEVPHSLPSVAVYFTGGTLDSIGRDRLDLAWYLDTGRHVSGAEFLASIPELETVARAFDRPIARRQSHGLRDRDWLELLRELHRVVDEDIADAIVLGHGTNTIEETAHFLHLAYRRDRPVVLVGAMRPFTALSSDAPLNVLNAIRVAADPRARGRGVLLVLNDRVLSAREATKTATYRVDAFVDREAGPVGYVDADSSVVWLRTPERPHTTATPFDVASLERLPRVDIALTYVGADGAAIDAFVAAGARGIVSAGTGAGHATPAEEDALDRAVAAGVVVCQASRVGSGRVAAGARLAGHRWVAAGDLVPWKARTLLSLALVVSSDPDEIQRLFDTY